MRMLKRLTAAVLALTLLAGTALAGEAKPKMVYRELYNAVAEDQREGFLFFTDPHMAETPDWEPDFEKWMRKIGRYADDTEIDLIFCGGDWIGSLDTNSEAVEKLSQVTDFNLMLFGQGRYHCAVGNHDTNEVGSADLPTRKAKTARLSVGAYTDAMMPVTGIAYYAIQGVNTRFYLLDSGYETQNMNAMAMGVYRWGMLNWFADDLLKNDPAHAAVLTHIYYRTSRNRSAGQLGNYMAAICEAFNKHSMVKMDGHTYDFRTCTGRVEFILCGHIHIDYDSVHNGIPVIATRCALSPQETGDPVLCFDLCVADYAEHLLTMVRVGDGETRTISLGEGAVSYPE
ncbi:MAG: metallophosphoesterase [Clostridia bacterium]|nr:metallophosphoesterase [Clostridia bacterium]